MSQNMNVKTEPIKTRADLERHLADMITALQSDERVARSGAHAAGARFMTRVFPEFLRAFDDECRDHEATTTPTDLAVATEMLIVNMLGYVANAIGQPGKQLDVIEHFLTLIARDAPCTVTGVPHGNVTFVEVPKNRAS